MPNISTIKEALLICRAARVTPMIWGHRGLGKSSAVNQITKQHGWGFVDFRCSQLEASDIRGLPARGEDGRTHYLPPADLPVGDYDSMKIARSLADAIKYPYDADTDMDKLAEGMAKFVQDSGDQEIQRLYVKRLTELQPHFQNGILFADEINRGQDDVLQALFQLVLDHRVGQYALPPGWSIVAAGNFMEGYQTSGFTDPAFLNRFCHMTLDSGETTLEEWIKYMSETHGPAAADVIEYASQNVAHLDGSVTGELGFSVQPSRRTWEMMVRVQNVCEGNKFSQAAKLVVYSGLVGRDLAISFSQYSCPVKPRELINNGVKQYIGALSKLSRNQLTGLMWGLVSFCTGKNESGGLRVDEENISTVCLDFCEVILNNAKDKDIVTAFCRALVSQGNGSGGGHEKARAAVISNPKLANMLAQFSKRQGSTKKGFLERLTERPKLQEALSAAAWGKEDADS